MNQSRKLEVTVNVGGLLEFLFLDSHIPDDEQVVIGISRVAYITRRDPANIFLPAAIWHDAAYIEGKSIQTEWQRWEVDAEFLKKMLHLAQGDYMLEKEAVLLYILVRKYGVKSWEGTDNSNL